MARPSVWLPGRSSMHHKKSRALRSGAIAVSSLIAAVALSGNASAHPRPRLPVRPETVTVSPAAAASTALVLPDSLFGRSGKLRFRLFSASQLFVLPILERLFGDPAADTRPGVYHAAEDIMGRPFAFISMIPFAQKSGGRVGDYR